MGDELCFGKVRLRRDDDLSVVITPTGQEIRVEREQAVELAGLLGQHGKGSVSTASAGLVLESADWVTEGPLEGGALLVVSDGVIYSYMPLSLDEARGLAEALSR